MRPTLERRISAGASSSSRHKAAYPTPTASTYGKSGNARGDESKRRHSLEGMVRWATPLASDEANGSPYQRNHTPRLTDLATIWPTATSADRYGSGSQGYGTVSESTGRPRSEGTTLTDAMALHHGLQPREIRTPGADGLVLCPEFVERLMGLVEGWTLVDDESASAALETPSSRRKRPRRSASSGSG